MDPRRVVGRNLKRLREAQGWSQEALADHAGLHRTYVSGVVRGIRNPTVTVLKKLADGLKATMGDLVDEEALKGPSPPPPPLGRA